MHTKSFMLQKKAILEIPDLLNALKEADNWPLTFGVLLC